MAEGSLNEDFEPQPRILLLGLRKSGKSSIHKVVFHKMSPADTLFLESTTQLVKEDYSSGSFIQFQIWDCPGQQDYSDPNKTDREYMFGKKGAVIFVIDAQDDYNEALSMLNKVFKTAYETNPALKFEVFIHKIDGIRDDQKFELHRYINDRATEDMKAEGVNDLHLSIHLTSIYDHSIYEAFSKVVQKLIRSLPELENMLTMFSSNSGIDKVYLFDIVTKIYIATDINQIEMEMYELCCDMIDVALDITSLYGENEDGEEYSGFDEESSSLIKLNTQYALYLLQVNRHLAVVCIISENNFQKRGTIDYNFEVLKKKINLTLEQCSLSHRKSLSSSLQHIQQHSN